MACARQRSSHARLTVATFLSLCADLARESGAIGPAPITTVGPLPNRQAQCVGWVRGAWLSIQNSKGDWRFLRGEFIGDTVPGQASYTPAELGITNFAEWIGDDEHSPSVSMFDPDEGKARENWLRQISYDRWRQSFGFGVHDLARPTYWSVGYDDSLKLAQTPDKAYKIRGEYRMTPQVLVADTDVPLMPERFHSAIWQRAIMLMAESDEAVSSLQTAQFEYGETYRQMVRDLLPDISAHATSMDNR
jgi:hypothetical protein